MTTTTFRLTALPDMTTADTNGTAGTQAPGKILAGPQAMISAGPQAPSKILAGPQAMISAGGRALR